MIKATLYIPGESGRELPIDLMFSKPLALFPKKPNGEPNPDREALADPVGVAQCLNIGIADVKLLYGNSTTLVYGHQHAATVDGRINSEALRALDGASGKPADLIGAILIITAG